MGTALTYRLDRGVATVAMDDGKANALSPELLGQIGEALDRAEADGATVLLHGRSGLFSAGFDLRVLGAGGPAAVAMLRGGFELSHRMLSFPRPIVIACTGHAIAMGAFLLLSADYRMGIADGDHRVSVNEVAIGLTLPRAAVEICRARLTPAHFQRATNLAEDYTHRRAVDAGFLDEVVGGDQLLAVAASTAERLASLAEPAHAATKARTRATALDALRRAIEADSADLAAL